MHAHMHAHTHTHMFNDLFSKITWVSRHQKGKPFWILLKQEMMGWHQLDHMQIICNRLQLDNHTSTSSLNFLQVAQPTVSKHCSSSSSCCCCSFLTFVGKNSVTAHTAATSNKQKYISTCCL